ncbi:MAG: hypothetical protein HY400_00265 [Elusimicrobia bacterium]|nr:hypothetical protein [Elusimicrobiota bacterium]
MLQQGQRFFGVFAPIFLFFHISPLLASQEPPPQPVWVRIFEGGVRDFAFDVAVDKEGFIVVAGASFLPAPGKDYPRAWDARIIKLDPDGNTVWNITFDGGDYDQATGIDTDPEGNIYIVSPISAFSPSGCRVLKLDPAGHLIWNRVVTAGLPQVFCHSIAVDDLGNAYGVGEVSEGRFLHSDTYVFKVDSEGVFRWDRRIDEGTVTAFNGAPLAVETFAMDAAIDSQRNLVLAGSHFQLEPLVVFRDFREFMAAKFDPGGALLFKRFFKADLVPFRGDTTRVVSFEAGFATGVSIDPADNILTGGGEWGSFDIATGFLQRGFLYGKLSPDGVPLIKKVLPPRGFTGSSASDATGNFYIPAGVSFPTNDVLISKVGPDGTLLWSTTTLRSVCCAEGTGTDVDQEGNVYVVGDIATTASLLEDIIVAKFRQGAPETALSIILEPAAVFPGGQTQVTVEARKASGEVTPDINITLTAQPLANSGGHDHDGSRPTGTFSGEGIIVASPAHGTTGLDGRLTATYTASEFGGLETIKAHLTDTPSVSTSAALEVRVPGLALAPPSGTPTMYEFTGQTSSHTANHFALIFTIAGATTAVVSYFNRTRGHILGINDMSLILGGLFDLDGNWRLPHSLHREGRSVDIDRCATFVGGSILVNQELLDEIMAHKGGDRIVERAIRPPPCAGPADTSRIHYEF